MWDWWPTVVAAAPSKAGVRTLLLVRNGVSHDARVLRAARVAGETMGGGTLVLGVATASSPAGEVAIEGVRVLRLPTGLRAPVAGSRFTPHSESQPSTPQPRTRPPSAPQPSRVQRRMTWRARAGRLLNGAIFGWRALSVARRERPVLVHANDWNTMWSGLAIKLVCRARLVYDSHELWADRNGRWEWRPWLVVSEALFTRAADAIVTASPGYADALAARYRMGRPTVIRNIPESPAEASGDHDPRDPSLLVYVGGILPGRGLEQTIDALALAPAIRLRAVGPGAPTYLAQLIERARRTGVDDRLELAPPVPPGAVTSLLEGASAGLCLIQPVCRSYELTLPNKLFEYAAAGVPVLASDLPVLAGIVRGDSLGEVVPPSDPRGIAAGLERLMEPRRRSETARHIRAFARANDWRSESRTLAALYMSSTARGSTARGSTSRGSTARGQR